MDNPNEIESNTTGVKLPYFHRVLTDEDASLIGDIRPKLIEKADAIITTTAENEGETNSMKVSAKWNTAQTWEERDCTERAKQKLIEIFNTTFECPEILSNGTVGEAVSVSINTISNLKGSSQITHIRGKARFFYEFSFELSFTINDGSKTYSGKLKIFDIVNDQLDDIELEIEWSDTIRPATNVISRVRQHLLSEAMKNALKQKFLIFEEEFRNFE